MIQLLLLAAAFLTGLPHCSACSRLARIVGTSTPRRGFFRVFVNKAAADRLQGAGSDDHHLPAGPLQRLRRRSKRVDEGAQAATWDLLAACLSSGMAVPAAIRAVAADLPDPAGQALRDTADLLALGGDPVEAWSLALECPATAGLARGARRTARSGAALAGVARALAADVRERTGEAAEARAQRAAVVISGPLALCFLPAFLCLGVVPIVLGLAGVLSNRV